MKHIRNQKRSRRIRKKLKKVNNNRYRISVSKSLNKRNNFDIDNGYLLWNKYNKNLIKISKNEKISIINFDNSNSFENKIKETVNNLGINFNLDSLKYYNPKHLNSKFQDLNDIKNNLETYNELIRLEKNNF